MRSPFAIFRKHQRVLMVVTIGLALFAFVICSGATDPTNMPKPLMALAIVCMCGGIAWVIGLPRKKSSETAVTGVILGAALAFVLIRSSGPPVAVTAKSGSISRDEFNDLRRRRELSNQFVSQAIFRTRDEADFQSVLAQYQFGGFDYFGTNGPNSEQDIVTTELLRREAEALGLVVPDKAVTDYINEITDNGMTPDMFKKLRQDLGVGEERLFEILAGELQARMAAEFLHDFDFASTNRMSTTTTPEQFWEIYRKIWVEQSAELAAIPVEDFVDETAEPADPAVLQQMFAEYRSNYPNQTRTRQLAEGRFGFRQPRKVEVAFLEVVFDDVQQTIDQPTEEEVDEYYQENYVRPAEERAAAAAAEAEMRDDDDPILPEIEFDESESESPESAAPEGESASPPPETPGSPQGNPDDTSEESSNEDAGTPESPEGADPESVDSGEAPESAGTTPEFLKDTQFVALQQAPSGEDETSADQPSAEDDPPGDDTTPDDAPADNTPETPASDDDAAAETGETAEEQTTEPAPPGSTVPPLTEALREQIRTEIVRELTLEEMKTIATAAMTAFTNFAYNMSLPEDDDEHLTAEDLSQEVSRYAEEHGLYFGSTPRLTFADLQGSEEFPVGSAFVEGRGTVAQTLSQSSPLDVNRADIAESLETDSRFVYWKTADHPEEVPESLDDDGVREQVLEAWRLEQARASAENRARELMTLIDGGDGDLEEALAGQTTTGEADADALVVVPTGEFRWLSDPRAPRPDPFFSQPQLRDPNGVTGAGPDFMETVFTELEPGDVGIAANADRSEVYLVKILERTPWGEEEDEVFRQEFLSQPIFDEFSGFDLGFSFSSVYQRMATAEAMRYRYNWVEQLWEKHEAQLLSEAS